jgi:hypothetical protein
MELLARESVLELVDVLRYRSCHRLELVDLDF